MRVLKINDLAGKTHGHGDADRRMDRRAGEPDSASDYWRRAVGEFPLQRGQFPRRRDDRLACPRLRSDSRRHGGQRFCGDGNREREITVGDVVHIKAGERHWHGATANSPLSHITVTTVGSTSKH